MEENRGEKKCSTTALPSEPGKLHLDYKTHPHFPPKFVGWGGVSYSPKNTVYSNCGCVNLGKLSDLFMAQFSCEESLIPELAYDKKPIANTYGYK